MDFKVILLFLIISLVLLYIVKELAGIKNLLKNTDLNQDNKFIKNKLNNLSQEIKDYNNDLLIQAKKINNINSQKITSISNYYTEEESSGNKNLLEYLSDVRNTVSNNQNFTVNYDEHMKNLDDLNLSDTSSSVISKTISSKSSQIITNIIKDISENTIIPPSNNDNNQESVEEKLQDLQDDNQNNKEPIEEKLQDLQDDNISLDNDQDINQDINQDNNQNDNEELVEKKLQDLQDDNVSLNNNQDKRDTKSVDTGNFNITTLSPLASYTKQQLDKIAKMLTIPITYMDGATRKTYKKEELYLKINEVLNKKSN